MGDASSHLFFYNFGLYFALLAMAGPTSIRNCNLGIWASFEMPSEPQGSESQPLSYA